MLARAPGRSAAQVPALCRQVLGLRGLGDSGPGREGLATMNRAGESSDV
jgi:hypothetical protein